MRMCATFQGKSSALNDLLRTSAGEKIQLSKKAPLPPVESKPNTDDVLHALLPPREWIEEGKEYPLSLHEKAYKAGVAGIFYPKQWGGTPT